MGENGWTAPTASLRRAVEDIKGKLREAAVAAAQAEKARTEAEAQEAEQRARLSRS